ncbi:hypothetical protein [Burkholderia sp. GbtcB21]|uniref:hypothetical protein n=1 Tax=Burkholderia sp. GbtcB21 TaxID=2824766 RepID=UPI0020C6E602|nr:hypothetical protein [Burkholderia sp. GbtcB21]
MIADGAYYSMRRPRRGRPAASAGDSAAGDAVVHDQPATRWHDHLVRYIKDKSIHAYRNEYGYGQRALVESQISRIKRCIGARLLKRRLESTQRESMIIANLLNMWNSFGRPVCIKNV